MSILPEVLKPWLGVFADDEFGVVCEELAQLQAFRVICEEALTAVKKAVNEFLLRK